MKRLSPLFSTLLFIVAVVSWQIPVGYPACPDATPGYSCGPSEVDDYTVLLIHFDNDTDWDFPEECSGSTYSPHGPSVTTWGGISSDPDINVDSAYFGTSGVSLDGNDVYVFSPDEEFQARTGDFTFECWAKVPSTVGDGVNAAFGSTEAGTDLFIGTRDGYLDITNNADGAHTSVTTDIRDDTWHHLVWARSGVTALLFVDGVKELALPTLNDDIYDPGQRWGLGGNGINPAWEGDMDEARYSVGICRWTENFSVPTEPY